MIIKVKVISKSRSHQGQGKGHFEVFQESIYKCLDFYAKTGGGLLSEC